MSEPFDAQGGSDNRYRICFVSTTSGSYLDEYLPEADRENDETSKAGEDSQVWKMETSKHGPLSKDNTSTCDLQDDSHEPLEGDRL